MVVAPTNVGREGEELKGRVYHMVVRPALLYATEY